MDQVDPLRNKVDPSRTRLIRWRALG